MNVGVEPIASAMSRNGKITPGNVTSKKQTLGQLSVVPRKRVRADWETNNPLIG